jgi:hypothetical protein
MLASIYSHNDSCSDRITSHSYEAFLRDQKSASLAPYKTLVATSRTRNFDKSANSVLLWKYSLLRYGGDFCF